MTIQTTELLQLFTKAKKLELSVEVREDNDGDYVIRIYEMFRPEKFEEKVFIDQNGGSSWNKGSYSFDAMMDVLDGMLEEKLLEEIKARKRKELIESLTPEQRELLGV